MIDTFNLNEPKAIKAIFSDSEAMGFSMASDPLTCSLLRTLAASKPHGNFLELGSGTGLSTAWILDGMDANSHLITIDNDESLLEILKKHLNDSRLQVICDDGDLFISSHQGQQFDFIFADTWSGKYRMLNESLGMLSIGGVYVIDDMLPQKNWPDGHAEKVASLVDALEKRRDFVITKLSWASGLIIATKVKEA